MWQDFGLEQKPQINHSKELQMRGIGPWILFTFDGATKHDTFEEARLALIAYYEMNFDAMLAVSNSATGTIQ